MAVTKGSTKVTRQAKEKVPETDIRAWCGRYKDWCKNKINKADCELSQRRDGCRYARFGLHVKF